MTPASVICSEREGKRFNEVEKPTSSAAPFQEFQILPFPRAGINSSRL